MLGDEKVCRACLGTRHSDVSQLESLFKPTLPGKLSLPRMLEKVAIVQVQLHSLYTDSIINYLTFAHINAILIFLEFNILFCTCRIYSHRTEVPEKHFFYKK